MATIRSINDLETLLKKLDSTAGKESRLEGYVFEKTFNESLGFSGNVADFLVFIPWRTWPQATFKDTHYPSALQEAFKDVLHKGADKSTCFIDLVTLNPHEIFFNESTDRNNPTDSVAQALAELIDQTDESVTPIIRFLAGSEENKTAEQFWNDNRKKFENIFWRDGKPLVKKNKKAKLYVGFYSPSFRIEYASVLLVALKSNVLYQFSSRGRQMDELPQGYPKSCRSPLQGTGIDPVSQTW